MHGCRYYRGYGYGWFTTFRLRYARGYLPQLVCCTHTHAGCLRLYTHLVLGSLLLHTLPHPTGSATRLFTTLRSWFVAVPLRVYAVTGYLVAVTRFTFTFYGYPGCLPRLLPPRLRLRGYVYAILFVHTRFTLRVLPRLRHALRTFTFVTFGFLLVTVYLVLHVRLFTGFCGCYGSHTTLRFCRVLVARCGLPRLPVAVY